MHAGAPSPGACFPGNQLSSAASWCPTAFPLCCCGTGVPWEHGCSCNEDCRVPRTLQAQVLQVKIHLPCAVFAQWLPSPICPHHSPPLSLSFCNLVHKPSTTAEELPHLVLCFSARPPSHMLKPTCLASNLPLLWPFFPHLLYWHHPAPESAWSEWNSCS